MAAACGIKQITVGNSTISFDKMVEALDASKGIKNIDEAIVASYKTLPASVSLSDWSNWFKRIHNVSKGSNITEEDLVGYKAGGRVTKLKKLLNFDGLTETVKGEKHYKLLPETVQTINMLKKRLLTKGDFLTNSQIDQLIDSVEAALFVSKLNNNADNLRAQAKSNLKAKLGAAPDLFPLVKKFLSLEFSQIPQGMREGYMERMRLLGGRDANLNLKEISENQEFFKAVIQAAGEPRTDAQAKEDDPAEKTIRIQQILNTKVDPKSLDEDEAAIAEQIQDLTEEDLDHLNNLELLHLIDGIENINNGFLTYNTNKIVEKIQAQKAYKPLVSIVKKIKGLGLTDFIQKGSAKIGANLFGGDGKVLRNITNRAKTAIDDIFGNTGREIYDTIFRPLSVAEQRYNREGRIIDERIDKVQDALFAKKKGNARIKSLYKLKLLEKQLEHESNPDSYSAMDYVSTITNMAAPGLHYTDEDSKILKELAEEFSDGQEFSLDSLKESLDKEEQELYNVLRELLEADAARVAFVSGVIRGNRVDIIANYSPSTTLSQNGVERDLENMQAKMLSSAKSGSLNERLKKSESPTAPMISLNPVQDARRALKQTALDFHMTPAIRHAQKVTKALQEEINADPDATVLAREAAVALKEAVDRQINRELASQYQRYDWGKNTMNKIQSAGYSMALTSPIRAAREFASNLSFVMLVRPLSFIKGMKNAKLARNAGKASEFLAKIGSIQIEKMYSGGAYTSRFVEQTFTETRGEKATKALSPTQARVQAVTDALLQNKASKGVRGFMEGAVTTLLSGPDKVVTATLYWGEFALAFKEKTGLDFNNEMMEKLLSDPAFYAQHEATLKETVTQADKISVLAAGTTSNYSGIDKIKQDLNDSNRKNLAKRMGYYLMTFAIWEADTWRQGVTSLVGKGHYSPREGGQMMMGAAARMISYNQSIGLMAKLMKYIGWFPEEEEEEEKDFTDEMAKELMGVVITLGGFGALSTYQRALPTMAFEMFNEDYMEGLRNGEEYKSWNHSILFSTIGRTDFGYGGFGNLMLKQVGPYKPLVKVGQSLYNDTTTILEAKTDAHKTLAWKSLGIHLGLSGSGYLGLNPLYRDMIKVADKNLRESKKQLKKTKKKKIY